LARAYLRWCLRLRYPAPRPFLSPDHSVFVNGVLIPIRYLVTGAAIAQEPRERVAYFRVELAHHDILFAAGLAAESYLDTGNRSTFANGGPAIEGNGAEKWRWTNGAARIRLPCAGTTVLDLRLLSPRSIWTWPCQSSAKPNPGAIAMTFM